MYCLFGVNKNIFFYFHFYAWFGVSLKSMGESFLLSQDEPLTPNKDGVMTLWIFRRRAQHTETGVSLTSRLCMVFIFFLKNKKEKTCPRTIYSAVSKKSLI